MHNVLGFAAVGALIVFLGVVGFRRLRRHLECEKAIKALDRSNVQEGFNYRYYNVKEK